MVCLDVARVSCRACRGVWRYAPKSCCGGCGGFPHICFLRRGIISLGRKPNIKTIIKMFGKGDELAIWCMGH